MIKNILLSSMLVSFLSITTNAETIEYKHYKITDEGVFYLSGKDEPLLLPYANPKAFVVLDDEVAKDDQSVYLRDHRVYGIDPLNFKKVTNNIFIDNSYRYSINPLSKALNLSRVDTETFEVFPNTLYSKDKNSIYFNEIKINDANFATFSPIDDTYAKDINNVYYLGRKIEYADPNGFTVIDDQYSFSKDKNFVYHYGKHINDLDPKTLTLVLIPNQNKFFPLFRDKSSIFLSERKINDADPITFKALSENFYQDKNNIYFQNQKIPNVDAESFQVINQQYAKDQHKVYWQSTIVEGADPNSMEIILYDTHEISFFFKDKHAIYNRGSKTDFDLQSFELLTSQIAKDKNNVYFIYDEYIVPINKSDPASFMMINKDYAKDKNYIYSIAAGRPSIDNEKMDPNSFQLLDNPYYSKDKKHVYRLGSIIEGANPLTFKTLTEYYSRDDKNIYLMNFKIPQADAENFKILNKRFTTKDNHHVYYKGTIIRGADPDTFIALNDSFSKDKNGCYEADKKVDCQ